MFGVLCSMCMYRFELLVIVGSLVSCDVCCVLVSVFLMNVLNGFFVLGIVRLFCGMILMLIVENSVVNLCSLFGLFDVRMMCDSGVMVWLLGMVCI